VLKYKKIAIKTIVIICCDISTCSDRKTAGCKDAVPPADSFVAVRCYWAWAVWSPSLPYLATYHRTACYAGLCTALSASAWCTRHDRQPVAVAVPSCCAAASHASCVCRRLYHRPHSEAYAAILQKKKKKETWLNTCRSRGMTIKGASHVSQAQSI